MSEATIVFERQPGNTEVGKIRPVFAQTPSALLKKAFNFEAVEVYEEEEVAERGFLGHYIRMPLQFDDFNYKHEDGNGVRRYYFSKLLIPIALVEISRTKVIEMTAVEGRDGTVKELGSLGDYVVNVKGIFIGDGKYPKDERDGLASFEEARVAVPVSNEILNSLGVFDMVIKDVRWVPMEGVEYAQAFEFTAYSDSPVQLKLLGEE